MTAAAQPLALFQTLCHTCNGTTRVPETPDDPGTGWTRPCPDCSSSSDLLEQRREYDPDRAAIPY